MQESDKTPRDYAAPTLNPEDQFITLPDGRSAIAGYKVQDMLSDMVLPNYREAKAFAKEAVYSAVPVANPFAMGKDMFPMVDGTAWTEPINEYLKERGTLIPNVPMVMGLIGPIAAGKTTGAGNLFKIFNHPRAFKRIHIMSPTGHTDPSIANLMRKRHPECEVTVHTGLDPTVMAYCFHRAQKECEKWVKISEESIYHRPSAVVQSVKKDQQEFDSIAHPWTNSAGVPHGRVPNLPPAVEKNLELIDPLAKVAMGGAVRKRKAEDDDETFIPNQGLFVASRRRAISANYSQAELYTQKMVVPISHAPACVDKNTARPENPVNNTPGYQNGLKAGTNRICMNNMTLQAMIRKVQFNHKTRDRQFDGMITAMRLRNEVSFLDVEDAIPTLVWLDDVMDLIHHHAAMLPMMRKWICNLRHGRMACIWGIQRIKGIDPTFRANSTHYMIYQIRNEGEKKILSEELGNVVTNGDFEELLHAATKPHGGRERDFLYLDIPNQIAGRSFEYQIMGTTAQVCNDELKETMSHSYENAVDLARNTDPRDMSVSTLKAQKRKAGPMKASKKGAKRRC